MEEMLHHTKAVVRGTRRALVVGDMPFLSYASPERGAGERRPLPARGGRPGGEDRGRRPLARASSRRWSGPASRCMGHIGLTPQAINAHRQGAGPGQDPGAGARGLLADALAVQEAGAFAVVLELVPAQLAAAITARPADPDDRHRGGRRTARGQVQVITDVLGLGDFAPRHARRYADLRETILAAARRLPRRRRGRHVPRRGRDDAHGRRRARRGPRAGRRSTGPGRRTPSSGGSRSTATSEPVGASCAPGPSCGTPSTARPGRSASSRRWAGSTPAIARSSPGPGPRRPTVVVTIFVNPRQFDDPSDLDRYPRSEARDLAICAEEGADLVWAPPVDEVYPPGFDTTVARRGDRRAARGRRPAGPLRRGGHGRGRPLRPGPGRARLLRR